MAYPVCYANKTVDSVKFLEAQKEANRALTKGKEVKDKEILSKKAQKKRAKEVCERTGVCFRDGTPFRDMNEYALSITNKLVPPIGKQNRTYTNLVRLFASKRVSTEDLIPLITLSNNPKKITEFRETAQRLFLKANLFYYDYVPYQGAIMCFMPKK